MAWNTGAGEHFPAQQLGAGTVTPGGDIAVRSVTVLPSSPYNVLAKPGAINGEQWAPPPSGDTTGATDATALQAALTALGIGGVRGQGGTLKLWPGIYYTNKRLIVYSHTVVQGMGREITTVQAGSGWSTRVTTDGAITTGTKTLTTATGTYTAADVGKRISVSGAGAAAGVLQTWIASVQSATAITLNDNAGTTAAGATVTPQDPMFWIGDTNLAFPAFASRLQDFCVDPQCKAGVWAVFSETLSEQGGIIHMLLRNTGGLNGGGFRISQPIPGAIGFPSNWEIHDLEIYPQATAADPAADASSVCIWVDNLTAQYTGLIDHVTAATVSTGVTQSVAIKLEGFIGGMGRMIHIEKAAIGIQAGTVLNCESMTLEDVNGGPGVTELIRWSNIAQTSGNGAQFINIWQASGLTTWLNDQVNGNVLTADFGIYILGRGTAGRQMILTDAPIQNKFPTGVNALGASAVTTSGLQQALTLTDTGASGAGLKLVGDGGTTPSKVIRVHAGVLGVANDAYTNVILALQDNGTLNVVGGIQPGTPALATQGGNLFMGAGVPANGNGNNGDFYKRTDGTEVGHTLEYHKETGAWVATAL